MSDDNIEIRIIDGHEMRLMLTLDADNFIELRAIRITKREAVKFFRYLAHEIEVEEDLGDDIDSWQVSDAEGGS